MALIDDVGRISDNRISMSNSEINRSDQKIPLALSGGHRQRQVLDYSSGLQFIVVVPQAEEFGNSAAFAQQVIDDKSRIDIRSFGTTRFKDLIP